MVHTQSKVMNAFTDDVFMLPASFIQRSLWFIDQLDTSKSAYTIPGAIHLAGALQFAALERSIHEIVRRHEILRTTFDLVGEEIVQVIHPELTLVIPFIDLSNLSEQDKNQTLEQYIQQISRQAFNLKQGPLLNAIVLQLQAEEHVLFLAVHHSIFDGWSLAIFVRELTQFYKAFVTQTPLTSSSPSLQFADFAIWQKEMLESGQLDEQIEYWKEQLEDAPAIINLPSDHPRLPIQTFRGEQYRFELSRQSTEALQALSEQQHVTLFMVLLTAFNILLYRYTGEHDILIGSPVAHRNRQELEDIIGPLVNILVMRTRIERDATFKDILEQVRETTLDAYTYQDVPFEKLMDVLDIERSSSYTPLFQVFFAFQNMPTAELELQDLTIKPITISTKVAKYDLTFDMEVIDGKLHGVIEYNTDMFEAETIMRLHHHFAALLQGIVHNPQQRIASLPLLLEAEQRQLLEWNATQQPYPSDHCIHWLIEEHVCQQPDALALVCGEERITYQQLDQQANQLAHFLRARHVGPEVVVGLCMERGIAMIVGLLAIWKAGGAYLPLDPAYPPQRLTSIIETVQLQVLLTQETMRGILGTSQIATIYIDSDHAYIAQESLVTPPHNTYPESVAYCIYTSGSTGTPKGVLVPHRGLCNMVKEEKRIFGAGPDSRVLQFASSSFDASVAEILMALCNGGQLFLTTKETILSSPDFLQLLSTGAITIAILPPSMLMSLPVVPLPALQTIIVAGEDCPSELVASWSTGRHFFNAYGLTETTVWNTAVECTPENAFPHPPIGQPIANMQAYVLDQELLPVAIGVIGELYLGGCGLARGYLSQGALTAERFIPHPFSQEHGARLYRTGDLVRYLPDGNLEFVGRSDHQIKLRGFLIEVGEIEAALRQHPAIREGAVILREDKPGEKHLVAYVVATSSKTVPSKDELRSFLQEHLPHYMVPTFFVTLDTLPLSLNGKIDVAALPVPQRESDTQSPTFVAPRTQHERILAAIWQNVLSLQQVGIYDNFFEMGGDSILAIQMVAKANQAGLSLKIRHLFIYPQIADLATHIETQQPTILAEQGAVQGLVPLTPIQHWFFEQEHVAPEHWNQSFLLQIRYPLTAPALREALFALIQHHDALRLRFRTDHTDWLQDHAPVAIQAFRFQEADLSQQATEQQRALLEQIAAQEQGKLRLADGPLLSATLFQMGEGQPQRLLLIIHHLVVDGVSWRILLEDLQQAYEQAQREEPIQLPAKTTSFQQWSQRLQAYAQSAKLQQETPYWQQVLDAQSFILPRDMAETSNLVADSQSISTELTREATHMLLTEVPKAYHVQIQEIFLAALTHTLCAWTEKTTCLIHLEGHGREDLFSDIDLSRTVGWFTSLFPVRLTVSNQQKITETLLAIKEQIRTIPQKGIGYGLLRYLNKDAPLKQGVKAEVGFNYLGQFGGTFAEAGLFAVADENVEHDIHPQAQRPHLIDIIGRVYNGKLYFTWEFNRHVHHLDTIGRLAENFTDYLLAFITHSASSDTNTYTPSDFSLAALDMDELDKLSILLDDANEDEA